MKMPLSHNFMKTTLTSAIALSVVAAPVTAFAQDYSTLISDTELQIEGLTAQQNDLYAQLASSYESIDALKADALALAGNLAEDDEFIATLEEEIATLEDTIMKREELLAEQARAVQVSGGAGNYLNYIVSSESVSDLVGRVDVINKMVSANKDLLNVQISDKEDVVTKRERTEEAKAIKETKMAELETMKAELAAQIANQEATYNQLTNDITIASQHRDALVAEQAAYLEQQAILAAQAAANQASLEASVAAAEQANSNAELQVQYEQALAEAQAQDAAIQQAQAEAEAAAIAEAEAEAAAQAAEAAAAQAREEANAIAADGPTVVDVVEEVPADLYVEESVEVEEIPESDLTVPETDQTWEVVEEEPVEEVVEEVPTEETWEPAPQPELNYDEINQAEAEAAQAEAEAQAAREAAEAAKQANAAAQANVSTLIANAEQFLGTPYVWGGKTPAGFDCSGFVQYVFKQTYGIDIGGWTGAQVNSGTQISVSEAQAGDLYFWGTPSSTYHVAIATGNGNYIHASQPGTPLEYNRVSSYFMPNFALRVNH